MSKELTFFEQHISSIYSLSSIYNYIKRTSKHMNVDAILRAEYVLIVSAFDNYFHNIVRRIIKENFFNGCTTPSCLNLPVNVYQMIYNEPEIEIQKEIFDSEVRKLLQKDSYQSPKSIEYALKFINIKHIWNTLSSEMNMPANNIKDQLALIIQRRNQIAHEADMNPINAELRSIDEDILKECREFLKEIVKIIDKLIT